MDISAQRSLVTNRTIKYIMSTSFPLQERAYQREAFVRDSDGMRSRKTFDINSSSRVLHLQFLIYAQYVPTMLPWNGIVYLACERIMSPSKKRAFLGTYQSHLITVFFHYNCSGIRTIEWRSVQKIVLRKQFSRILILDANLLNLSSLLFSIKVRDLCLFV